MLLNFCLKIAKTSNIFPYNFIMYNYRYKYILKIHTPTLLFHSEYTILYYQVSTLIVKYDIRS